jgi:small subunit ribosomal protein S6
MREYEFILILTPAIDAGDTKKIDTLVAKLFGAQSKAIKSTEVMGKKKLSYPINKEHEGVYVLLKLSADRIDAGKIGKQVKLMPEIMRYMLTLAKE